MSLRNTFKTDEQKENEGVAIKIGERNADGTFPTFYLARTGKSNREYMKALERALRPMQARVKRNQVSTEESDEIMRKVFVDHVLKKWEHVPLQDVTGDPASKGYAPFTKENATKLLTDLPDLFDELTQQADNASNFRSAELEEQAGN